MTDTREWFTLQGTSVPTNNDVDIVDLLKDRVSIVCYKQLTYLR